MEKGIFKRTTFVVENAKTSAEFYSYVFGWPIWYDNILEADHRFPPIGSESNSNVHLIILDAADAKIGKLGFLQFLHAPVEQNTGQARTNLRVGDPILVIEYQDIDQVYQRAIEKEARVITPPVDWQVPGPEKDSTINLRTISLFDPNGIYMEVSAHPTRNKS